MDQIKHELRSYDNKTKVHDHQHGQMIIPVDGKLIIETETIETDIGEDKLLFLPPNSEHMFSSNTFDSFLILDIPKAFLINDDMKKVMGGKIILMDEKWTLIRQLILKECMKEGNPYGISNLFRYFFYQDLVGGQLYASISYINENFSRNISLSELAKIEGYAPNYYSEWFKRKMEMSIPNYIKLLRVGKVKEMLLTTDYSLMQIAQFVGYSHHATLTRVFKEITGLTPSEFKKQQLNKSD